MRVNNDFKVVAQKLPYGRLIYAALKRWERGSLLITVDTRHDLQLCLSD